jgi:ABC-type Na+ transport system ATPase subunit NatA
MNKYRSGLEVSIAKQLKKFRIKFDYEKLVILYTKPAQSSTYTPDFRLANGIIIETKGRFVVSDRKKHLLIKKQYGNKYDIRFVFSNAKAKIYKGSKTTYADWCIKHNFKYFNKTIPMKWIKEKHDTHYS